MDFGMADMALTALSSYETASANPSSLTAKVSTAVLSQSLDQTEQMGDAMVQMMERSVTPELGGSIDVYV